MAPRGRDLIDVVDDLLPTWGTRRPRRVIPAAWATRPLRIGDREARIPVLPLVDADWFVRGRRYWWRRISRTLMLLVAAVVIVCLDVGFVEAAAESGAAVPVVAVGAVLAVMAALLHWRADLFVRCGIPGTHPLPRPVKAVGVVLGGIGLISTPTWLLSVVLDQFHRFPPQERAAWQVLVAQLSSPLPPTHRPAARRR